AVLFLRDSLTGRHEIRDFLTLESQRLDEMVGTLDLNHLENTFKSRPYILATESQIGPFFRRVPSFGQLHEFFSVPVKMGDCVFGFINVYNFSPARRVLPAQGDLLAALASQAAPALAISERYENLREAFKETIRNFALEIERKDLYTGGHSTRT